MLFAVTKEGVYRHGILGVFTSVELARKAAEQAILKEEDAYHAMAVVHVSVNELGPEVEIGRWVRKDTHRQEQLTPNRYKRVLDKVTTEWKESAPVPLDPHVEGLTDLALALLEGDPVAIDLCQDALSLGGR